MEDKIKSKKLISETLRQTEKESKEIINVPLKAMVNVANKTVKNFLSNLTESEQKELNKILSTPKETLVEDYNKIKDEVTKKLGNTKLTESDDETVNTIDKVLGKLQTESFNELNYYKLIKLSESL
jgi:F0F1-type ATP synthase membrane subunit b/b'